MNEISVRDRYNSEIEILSRAIQNITSNHLVVPDVPGSRVVTIFNTYLNMLKTSCFADTMYLFHMLCIL
jgi:hypothetical protein